MNNMNDKKFDLVMPAAKKLILENDIDANIMQGTGKDGRITKGDVLLFLKSNGSSQKTTDNKYQEENLKINENRKGSTMDIIVPTLGESIVEATVSKWLKNEGEYVEVDEPVVELETDKVTLEVPAPISGLIGSIIAAEGETVEVGQNIGALDPNGKKSSDDKPKAKENNDKEEKQLETKDTKTSSPDLIPTVLQAMWSAVVPLVVDTPYLHSTNLLNFFSTVFLSALVIPSIVIVLIGRKELVLISIESRLNVVKKINKSSHKEKFFFFFIYLYQNHLPSI